MDVPTDFETDYLASWTEADPAARRRLVEALWAPDGRLSLSSPDMTLEGPAAIAEHVGQVHADLVAGRGLSFRYDQRLEAGGATLLRWSMTAPDGAVVGRGADVVHRAADGRIATVHMFMGVA